MQNLIKIKDYFIIMLEERYFLHVKEKSFLMEKLFSNPEDLCFFISFTSKNRNIESISNLSILNSENLHIKMSMRTERFQ